MIRLTHTSGKSVYIVPENIVDFLQSDMGDTLITFVSGDGYRVKESPEEVARKVMEYRMTFEKYRIGLELEKPHLWEKQRKKMLHLAGLEDKNG